jgi:hypothetical protein
LGVQLSLLVFDLLLNQIRPFGRAYAFFERYTHPNSERYTIERNKKAAPVMKTNAALAKSNLEFDNVRIMSAGRK